MARFANAEKRMSAHSLWRKILIFCIKIAISSFLFNSIWFYPLSQWIFFVFIQFVCVIICRSMEFAFFPTHTNRYSSSPAAPIPLPSSSSRQQYRFLYCAKNSILLNIMAFEYFHSISIWVVCCFLCVSVSVLLHKWCHCLVCVCLNAP